MRVGLIGLGAIGLGISRLARDQVDIVLVGALVRDVARPRPAETPPAVGTLDELLALRPEVIVEGAGHEALRAYGPAVLRAGCDLIALAAGALAEPGFVDELRAAAREGHARLRIASGAIAGLDALSAAAAGGLTSVTHTVRKPARTLLGEAAAELTGPRELYRGPARAGVLRFPESANVVAAVSLAGIGLDGTQMCVVADPSADRNQHIVEASGMFGSLRVEVQNVPSDENPRTGRLTAMSAFRALLARHEAISIG